MRMRWIVLAAVVLWGCEEPGGPQSAPPAAGSARPSANVAAPPAASASAPAAAPSAWPGGQTLAQLTSGARSVKVTRLVHEGTRVEMRAGVLSDVKDIDALVAAVGRDQTPESGCVRCMPSVTLGF